MLHSVKALDGFTISATDGELGHVKDIYFDDLHWTIRYLEVDTGGWLTGRRVLISPLSISSVDWEGGAVEVLLTRQQVHDSPGIETARPVSRQHETSLFNFYGYPYYWTGPYIWGYTALPTLDDRALAAMPEIHAEREAAEEEAEPQDRHLHCKDEVIGYGIDATDEAIGHVDDFLFDEKDWSIRLMVVDTSNWWAGKHVLIPPGRIERVSWEDKSVFVNVTRAQIENSPEYDVHHPLQGDADEEVYFRDLDRPAGPPPGGIQDTDRPSR